MYYPISKPDWDKYKCSVSYTYGQHGTTRHDGIDYCPNNPGNAAVPIIAPMDGYCNQWKDGNGALYSWIVNGNIISNQVHYRELVGGSRQVKAGDVVGIMGMTGNATGVHLHWGVKVNGVFINPDSLNPIFFNSQPSTEMVTLENNLNCTTTNTVSMNVRQTPNTTAPIVDHVAPNTNFTTKIVASGDAVNGNTNWYKYNNGYINQAYVKENPADCSAIQAQLTAEQAKNVDYTTRLNNVHAESNLNPAGQVVV